VQKQRCDGQYGSSPRARQAAPHHDANNGSMKASSTKRDVQCHDHHSIIRSFTYASAEQHHRSSLHVQASQADYRQHSLASQTTLKIVRQTSLHTTPNPDNSIPRQKQNDRTIDSILVRQREIVLRSKASAAVFTCYDCLTSTLHLDTSGLPHVSGSHSLWQMKSWVRSFHSR
jgi:hypothetical protein